MKPVNAFPLKPILVVDDEEQFLFSIKLSLRTAGMENVVSAQTGAKAKSLISAVDFSVIVLDINLPDLRGDELLDLALEQCPQTPVIIITAVNEANLAVECMKKGAVDYLIKPLDEERMLTAVRNAVSQRELRGENEALKQYLLGRNLSNPGAFKAIVTQNNKMHSLFQYVEAIAQTPFPVLITGETGVGKELFAKAVHDLSGRKGRFVTVNAAGIDDTTFSDTLFGHVRGAFTGAEKVRPGLIEQAAGGTLFLDEIGDISHSAQMKLLRVIQNREYFPLGADAPKIADVRMIVATNKSIDDLKRPGGFRSDLFHRLRTHHVAVPALRERLDDLPLLIEHFLAEAAETLGRRKVSAPPELPNRLRSYSFPGNVRELRAMILDAVSLERASLLSMKSFREAAGGALTKTAAALDGGPEYRSTASLPSIREATDSLIREALVRANGNQNKAAKMLGISPQALSRRLKYARRKIT